MTHEGLSLKRIRALHEEILEAARRNDVFIIIPMMWIVDKATGQTVSAVVKNGPEDR